MTLARLRGYAPEWTWSAERSGMGWEYIGVRGDATVRVRAVAELCGPCEDDYATAWYCDDGKRSQRFASWWLEQHAKDGS